MKTIFTFTYPKGLVLGLLLLSSTAFAQSTADDNTLNMDAVQNRPSLTPSDMGIAVGGYLEGNSIYTVEDGVTEGLSFQARRLTVFMSASISNRIKFMSEMEYEDGTEEIGIEFAAIDISLHPAFNLRSGIITNPIGAFNQNHDGPKWEFVERPDVAVNLLAATWANAGFGMYGKTHHGDWILGYEAYLSNGFDNNIVDNDENKTFLPAAKGNGERFEESNSGKPLLTAKAAVKNRKIGEVGFSYMGGVYNQFNLEGSIIAPERRVDVVAIDFNTTIQKTGTYIVGEAVLVHVDVPETHSQQYGETQRGAFVDIVQPILKKSILDWDNAVLNLSARLDYVDWNVGTYEGLDDANIGDELWAITPAVSFRPTAQTVIRANYRYQLQNDILSNPAAISASFTLGFSTYF